MRDKQCPICPYATFETKVLEIHFKNAHGTKDKICPMCYKAYATDTALKYHMQSAHLKEKPFPCNLCDYRQVGLTRPSRP